MYGQVRHNLCFGDIDQVADYQEGKGTVIPFQHSKYLFHIRNHLHLLICNKANRLVAETNHYYNVNKCGIRFHGDSKHNIVIGIMVGIFYYIIIGILGVIVLVQE